MDSKLSGHSHDTAIIYVSGPNSRCMEDTESNQALRLSSCRFKLFCDHHRKHSHQRIISELYKYLVNPALRGWFVGYRFSEGLYIAML